MSCALNPRIMVIFHYVSVKERLTKYWKESTIKIVVICLNEFAGESIRQSNEPPCVCVCFCLSVCLWFVWLSVWLDNGCIVVWNNFIFFFFLDSYVWLLVYECWGIFNSLLLFVQMFLKKSYSWWFVKYMASGRNRLLILIATM